MSVSLCAYPVNLAGDRWRYLVTARGGSLKADVPDWETAERFFARWAELTENSASRTARKGSKALDAMSIASRCPFLPREEGKP